MNILLEKRFDDMNILLLTSSFPGKANPIAGIFIQDLAKYMSNAGHKIYVVTPKTDSKDLGFENLPVASIYRFVYSGYQNRKIGAGTRSIPIFSVIYFIIAMFLVAERVIRKEHIDVIHCFWAIPSGFVGILLKKFFGLPVVMSALGSDLNVWSYKRGPGAVIGYTIRHMDYVFVLGDLLKKRAIELGVKPEKVQVTLGIGGVDPSKFYPRQKDKAFLLEYGVSSEHPLCLFVGRLAQPKRLDLVLLALVNHPNIRLLVVGDGPDAENFKSIAKKLLLDRQVIFLGQVPLSFLLKCYAATDFIVYPSENEGVPTTLLEGQAMGVPAIASAVGGIPDIIQDGINGLLARNSVDSFHELLTKVEQDRTILDRMRVAAIEFSNENLLPDKLVSGILKVYDRLIRNKGIRL